MTSAGVRMAQDTSSATAEAKECIIGVGREIVALPLAFERGDRRRLIASYVVKNAPAANVTDC
jgi:hypothetical protein